MTQIDLSKFISLQATLPNASNSINLIVKDLRKSGVDCSSEDLDILLQLAKEFYIAEQVGIGDVFQNL